MKAHIEKMAQAVGRETLDRNNRQTRVPQGATVWLNQAGTAPGLCLEIYGCVIVLMPGVPGEFNWLTENFMLPFLKKRFAGEAVYEEKLRCFGLPEARLAEKLETIAAKNPDLKIQYRPSFPETTIRLTLQNSDLNRFNNIVSEMKSALGDACYGTGADALEERIIKKLVDRGEKIVVAESCTGGLLAQKLTAVPGASAVFWGGWVTYDNQAKIELLNVSTQTLQEHGAVSEGVAKQMVRGALQGKIKTWALSLTGVAGPGGGTPEKPVGTVCFGLGHDDLIEAKTRHLGSWSREQIRILSVHVALHWLRRKIGA